MSNIFWTADTHFWHTNIIKYQNRPFSDREEMNEVMIKNWNDRVKPKDTIYHLGDFGFTGQGETQALLNRLNGKIHLLLGNHDRKWTPNLIGWETVGHYKQLKIDKKFFVMCHYPIERWNRCHHGSIHLHGHTHGNLLGTPNRFDVGVDVSDFKPVSLEQILDMVNKQTTGEVVQHHNTTQIK